MSTHRSNSKCHLPSSIYEARNPVKYTGGFGISVHCTNNRILMDHRPFYTCNDDSSSCCYSPSCSDDDDEVTQMNKPSASSRSKSGSTSATESSASDNLLKRTIIHCDVDAFYCQCESLADKKRIQASVWVWKVGLLRSARRILLSHATIWPGHLV